MKKIITLTMIKNEADIIEVFARYTLNYATKMYFIDNGCTDGSVEILNKLIEEGKNIVIYHEATVFYEQEKLENEYLKIIASENDVDYVIPIDADEFLDFNGADPTVFDSFPKGKVIILDWKTYCLEKEKDVYNPLDDITTARVGGTIWTKVILPREAILNGVEVAMGHHMIKNDYPMVNTDKIYIGHFPVRSKDQIKFKLYQGVIGQLMSSYHSVKASHLRNMFWELKENKFDAVRYSKNYGIVDDDSEEIGFKKDKLDYSWCTEPVEIRYSELIQNNVEDLIFSMTEQLVIRSVAERDEEKVNVLIYGTGEYANRFLKEYDNSKYNVLACVNSNVKYEYMNFNGKIVISPKKIKFIEYDNIVIAAKEPTEIRNILLKLGASEDIILDVVDIMNW